MRQTVLNCALVIAAALGLAGCGEHAASTPEQANVKYFVKTFSTFIYSICIGGHEYIVFDGTNSGNIIHSLSCPCRRGDAERHVQEPADTNRQHSRNGLD